MYEVTRQIIRLFTLGDDDDVILTGGKSKHNPDTRGVHSKLLVSPVVEFFAVPNRAILFGWNPVLGMTVKQ